MSEVLHHYFEIMTDPAHLLAEVTLFFVDVIFLALIWRPIMKVRDKRAEARVVKVVDARIAAEHAVIDAEHGVFHPEPVTAPAVREPAGAGRDNWRRRAVYLPPRQQPENPEDLIEFNRLVSAAFKLRYGYPIPQARVFDTEPRESFPDVPASVRVASDTFEARYR